MGVSSWVCVLAYWVEGTLLIWESKCLVIGIIFIVIVIFFIFNLTQSATVSLPPP